MSEQFPSETDEAEWEKIGRWFAGRDPAKAAPQGFSGRRRRRIAWLMGHPVFAFVARHHRATALLGAAAVVALALAALFAIERRDEKVLPPVRVVFAPGGAADGEADALEPDSSQIDVPGEYLELPVGIQQ